MMDILCRRHTLANLPTTQFVATGTQIRAKTSQNAASTECERLGIFETHMQIDLCLRCISDFRRRRATLL